jgi:glutamate N-acetyltransferase / amino-acid N-acetyltransferase
VSVVAPKGFLASGVAAGIKPGDVLDLALVVAANGPVAAAATFTTNLAAAAPVQVSRAHLQATSGRVGAVILNSGCANAATGVQGLATARATTAAVATSLGFEENEVLVCSTGLIGPQLSLDALLGALPEAVRSLGEKVEDGDRAARAIMTTDTKPKLVSIEADGFSVGGMAKGAGMIAPNMATMLCVITTDADVEPSELQSALREAVAGSFNALIVDGSTSTNDTVIALASGLGATPSHEALTGALSEACSSLAEQMAADAEGTSKVATILVSGAASDEDAARAARKVAGSLLVKTSLFGSDPYWGRVVSELGSSGASFDLLTVDVRYGGVLVFSGGEEIPHDRGALVAYLSKKSVEISCDLGLGAGGARVVTTDLGHSYIDENMKTS